jgi:drug/metabolite transporter (DMT)-like permease
LHKKAAWFRSIFGTLAAAGTFYTLAQPGLGLGDAVTLFQTSPIFVALLSWPMLGERVRGRTAVAIGVAFLGILAVAQPAFQSAPQVVVIGSLTAVVTAVAMIWLRRIGPGESSEAIVLHFSLFGAVATAAASVPVWRTPDAHSGALLLVTGVAGGLGQLCMTRAYSLDHAARVSAIGYSGLLFARLFAVPAFGEIPNAMGLAGSVLVLGSGVWLATHKAEPHRRRGEIPPRRSLRDR